MATEIIPGTVLEVDITPPWWGMSDYATLYRATLEALLEAREDMAFSEEFTIGVKGIRVRLRSPVGRTSQDHSAWRERMIARLAARPELQERQARWAQLEQEWQEEKREERKVLAQWRLASARDAKLDRSMALMRDAMRLMASPEPYRDPLGD